MGYPTKYHNPKGQQIGCCICARKFSSSRYIKYNAKFSEELFLIVFQLESMAGRRGYLCNPCVLVMKRYQKKLEAGVPPEELPNYAPRVDSCLKRGSKRQRCTQDRAVDETDDLDGEGDAGEGTSRSTSKSTQQGQKGYRHRFLTLQPRTVFTGRKTLHLRSKHQLIPAQCCEEPSEDEEDEMSSESEMAQYRRTQLKHGRKTLQQKADEKARREATEDQRLFGDPDEDPGYKASQAKHKGLSIYTQKQRPVPAAQKVLTRRQVAKELDERSDLASDVADRKKMQASETNSDTASTQEDAAETIEEADPEYSMDSSCLYSNSQGTADTGLSVTDRAGPSGLQAKKQEQAAGRMSLWNRADKDAITKPLEDNDEDDEGEEPVDRSIDALEEELLPMPPMKKRRVGSTPVHRFKRPQASFLDRTYFQKFQLCCVPVYVGENQLFVMDVSKMTPGCPVMREHLRRMQEKHKQKREAASVSQSESQTTSSESVSVSEHVPDSSESTCSEASDGRAHLLPSPVEPSTSDFHFCSLEGPGPAQCKMFVTTQSSLDALD